MWTPDIKDHGGKLYVAIANALAEDIARGNLLPGERLPTHRELAWHLKVSVSTISKAYALAERRHLVEGTVGRGTFITTPPGDLPRLEPNRAQSDLIDLSFNSLIERPSQGAAIAQAMRQLADNGRMQALVPYHRQWLGLPEHRLAAAHWLEPFCTPARVDDIVIVNGAQQATAAILNALTAPGDTILLEELTDPGIRFLAANRHLKVRSIEIDQFGIVPDAFEAACQSGPAQVLFCIPTHHSPTLAVMPLERRRSIADIAQRYGVTIIENDVCGMLLENSPPPIASLTPENVFYVTSLSKVISAGLRIGFIVAPPGRAGDLVAGLASTTWMASLISAAIACQLIDDGSASRLLHEQREELRRRQLLACDILDGHQFSSLPTGMHVWLTLPESWRAEGFVAAARSLGIALTPAEAFTVGHGASPQAVRVSLGGATQSRADLQQGLETIAELLRGKRSAASLLVL